MAYVEASRLAERRSIVGRIIAIGRAFAKGDPLQGLKDSDINQDSGNLSKAAATKRWLFGGPTDE